jgi:hypothetical protein
MVEFLCLVLLFAATAQHRVAEFLFRQEARLSPSVRTQHERCHLEGASVAPEGSQPINLQDSKLEPRRSIAMPV